MVVYNNAATGVLRHRLNGGIGVSVTTLGTSGNLPPANVVSNINVIARNVLALSEMYSTLRNGFSPSARPPTMQGVLRHVLRRSQVRFVINAGIGRSRRSPGVPRSLRLEHDIVGHVRNTLRRGCHGDIIMGCCWPVLFTGTTEITRAAIYFGRK